MGTPEARRAFEEITASLRDAYFEAYKRAALTGGAVKVEYSEESRVMTVRVVELYELYK